MNKFLLLTLLLAAIGACMPAVLLDNPRERPVFSPAGKSTVNMAAICGKGC
jgi:hypothetical protein